MPAPIKPGRACPKCAGNLDAACHAPGCLSASQMALKGAYRYLDEQPRRKRGRSSVKCPPVGNSRKSLADEMGIAGSLLDEAIRVVDALRERGDETTLKELADGKKVVGRVHDEILREERRGRMLKNVPAPPDGRWQVIYADPPWKYEDDGVGRRGVAEDHYGTMTIENLIAMRPMIDEISASNAMIVMWATSALLPQALRLLEAWGFTYVSSAIWHKSGGKIGMGSIFRIDHEFLLVGRRGGGLPVAPDAHNIRSVISVKPGEHSVKPDEIYDVIERFWPEASKIELFARQARVRWMSWGDQAPKSRTSEYCFGELEMPESNADAAEEFGTPLYAAPLQQGETIAATIGKAA